MSFTIVDFTSTVLQCCDGQRFGLLTTVTARRHIYTQSEKTCDIVQNTLSNASELLQNVEQWAAINNLTPVSYTHLTLPTIYSV